MSLLNHYAVHCSILPVTLKYELFEDLPIDLLLCIMTWFFSTAVQ
jgi:hypothetical protein